VWLLIQLAVKVLLLVCLYAACGRLGDVANWLFSPLQDHPNAELLLVMLVCPGALNVLQFWIVDSFLKSGEYGDFAECIVGPASRLIGIEKPSHGGEDEQERLRSLASARKDSTVQRKPLEAGAVRLLAGGSLGRDAEWPEPSVDARRTLRGDDDGSTTYGSGGKSPVPRVGGVL
jgi:hypothetical protein